MEQQTSGAMEGLLVLELGHELGAWCGKHLADMGARVLKIEPPTGDQTRGYPPFYQDQPDPDGSLFFWHYNTNKGGVTLDLTTATGRELFLKMAAGADLVIDAFPPCYLDGLGIGYRQLQERNPSIIVAGVTPFGREGPYQEYAMTDLTGLAFGGPVWSTGYDDHSLPPVRGGGNQWAHTGGSFATIGILIALLHRQQTGEGQFVDVNMHAAVNVTTEGATSNWLVARATVQRQTGRHSSVQPTPSAQFRCRDGRYINAGSIFRSEEQWIQLLVWFQDAGVMEDISQYIVPPSREAVLHGDPKAMEHRLAIAKAMAELAATTDAYDMFVKGQEMGFQWGIIYSPEEMMEDPHFIQRGFVTQAEHPELDASFRYPGAPFIFSATPWSLRRRAPLLGEDNEAVYLGELGLSETELAALKVQGVV